MGNIFLISMESLFATLFWGNVITIAFLIMYYRKNKFMEERKMVVYLIASRLCHAVYYYLATGRGVLPDLLSVNFGNSLMLLGFYLEAQAILRVIKYRTKRIDRQLRVILAVSVMLFNVLALLVPTGGIRITMASLGVVAIMILPTIRMLISKDSSTFTRSAAVLYCVYLFLLTVRAWYGLLNPDTGIMETNFLHSVTFLSLLLQHIVALPAYILIMKDYADRALLLMATTDRLTGATNRHAFLDAAAAIHKNSRLFHIPISVLFLDIDHFKAVNDTYGHAFGDTVLSRFAEIIDKCMRGSDLSCRYGGEEFVVLLSRSDIQAAKVVSERIMREVREARFPERPEFSFTVSIGVYSGVPFSEESFDEIIKHSDEAMYKAKKSGRNQIVYSERCYVTHTEAEDSEQLP